MIDFSKATHEEFIIYQTSLANDKIRPFMRCGCLKKLELTNAYKCLYCKEWFCEECAEKHFGKTIEEYNKQKAHLEDKAPTENPR
jgi:hypothetical protein